jgi:hypothetical protein
MSDELRFNLNLILISGIAAFHPALTEPGTAFAFIGNMFFNLIRFSAKLHSCSLMSGLSALFLPGFPAKTLGSWFLQPSFGRWFGTYIPAEL